MLKRMLVTTTLVAPLPAHAVTAWFGFWDNNFSGGVQPLISTGPDLYTLQNFYLGTV
jgi:hypothetical protein